MNKHKKHSRTARGKARWQAARLEGKQKNRGIKKTKKKKGARTERRRRKVATRRVSKRRGS